MKREYTFSVVTDNL